MITVIIIIDLSFTVVVFIASRIFGNMICKPLIEIQNFANRMSTGDLTTGVSVSSNNELGKQLVHLILHSRRLSDLSPTLMEFPLIYSPPFRISKRILTA